MIALIDHQVSEGPRKRCVGTLGRLAGLESRLMRLDARAVALYGRLKALVGWLVLDRPRKHHPVKILLLFSLWYLSW